MATKRKSVPCSPEKRAKISAALRGRVLSDATRANLAEMAAAARGVPRSLETRAKIAAGRKGVVFSDAHLANMAASQRGKKQSLETIAKRTAHAVGKPHSEEWRANISAGQLSERACALRAAVLRRRGPTSIEARVREALTIAGVEFVEQQRIGRYVVDFYLKQTSAVIEADGRYWHSLPGARERDARKDLFLAMAGLRVWRLREDDIKSGRAFKHSLFKSRGG